MTARFCYKASNVEETEKLGRLLSTIAQKTDCFALFGTLGTGKSVLARAFIKNLTDTIEVPSPTFTLVQTYSAKDFEIYHFDLYRLKTPDEIWELNIEEALSFAVSLIEWPEKMSIYLPRNCFKVCIKSDSDTSRFITIEVQNNEQALRLEKCGLTRET